MAQRNCQEICGMTVATAIAQLSPDPVTKVGACILNSEGHIMATGCNEMPARCAINKLPWTKTGEWLDSKYPYVVHAEANAILRLLGRSTANSTLYCTLLPCNECAKLIIQIGITHVIYQKERYDLASQASKRLFASSQTSLRQSTTDLTKQLPE